jgi:SRSO17 transposase
MLAACSRDEGSFLERWSETLADLHAHIAHRFTRAEVRARAGRYLAGLLGRVERKNGWQLAEAIGETELCAVQRLLSNASWDAEGVRDDLRAYVVEHLGEPESGVPIVDDTGFVKKGDKSVGIARQYTGTIGDIANAQVGVFLAYASAKGAAFVDRALYLPRAWTDDPGRCRVAGIPATVRFATKITLAQRMLERAFVANVPARWVVADAFYGCSHTFRRWREERGQALVLMVPNTHAVRYQNRRQTAAKLVERLPSEACLPLSEEYPAGMRRWLLVQRSADDPSDLAYHLADGPEATPEEELLRVCGSRWQIEEGFAQAKGEVGLDQYEVRRWEAWHRFMTLCLLAHAYLVVMRLAARQEEEALQKGEADPHTPPPSGRGRAGAERQRQHWVPRKIVIPTFANGSHTDQLPALISGINPVL